MTRILSISAAVVLTCLALALRGQAPMAPNGFGYRSPVSHPIKASGTFGELRRDHFHMGLDVKSARGRTGDALYSVADGYVSRLRVSATGYGNSVYIDHPNGTRSVYAHLDEFTPEIQRLLDSVHYAEERFEIDVRLSPKQIAVAAGQQIGTMGNTGSSQGPHLHFELRRADTDAAMNPLMFGFPVRDGLAPSLRGLTVYQIDGDGRPTLAAQTNLRRSGDSYRLDDELRVPLGRIGFGLKAYDVAEGTSNLNGVYRIECRVDDELIWRVTYDTIAYEETRFIQAHYDFAARARGEGYFYRLYRLPGDRLGIYESAVEEGAVSMGFGESRRVEIEACDALGNSSVLRFAIRGDTARKSPEVPPFNYVLEPDTTADFALGDAAFRVERGSVYTKTFLRAAIRTPTRTGALSSCYEIGQDDEPLQLPVAVTLPLKRVPAELRSKVYLGRCDGEPRQAMPSEVQPDGLALRGEMRDWTDFAIFVDTVPPSIKELSRGVYRIADDVTGTGALRYRVTHDGVWVLASLDAKRNRLEVRADKLTAAGELRVEVVDAAGNVIMSEG